MNVKTIAESIHEVISRKEWDDGFAKNPGQWHKPGECRYCSTPIPEPLIIESETGGFKFPVTVCEPCVRTRREAYEREQAALGARHIAKFCPLDFADPWLPLKGNPGLYREAFKAFSVSSRQGLILHGPSGGCKTRVAWEIIKSIETNPPDSAFIWKFLDSFEMAAKGIPPEAYTASLLVIDDLGNEPPGSKWETGLLYLLRKRCDFHRLNIITTQLTGAQLAARFFSGAAAAGILRCLMQRCTAISTSIN